MWITPPWFSSLLKTHQTYQPRSRSLCNRFHSQQPKQTPKGGKAKGKGKVKGKGKGRGKGKGKPKSASSDVAEGETWEEGGEDWYDEGGEAWQEEEEQPEAAHAELEEEVFCAKATMDTGG
eukprot:1915718-Amphidinium_carterae.2